MRGVTLIELMCVLVIVAILSGVGLSHIGRLMREARYDRFARELISLMHYAEGMAYVSHRLAGVCIASEDRCVTHGRGTIIAFKLSHVLKRITVDDSVTIYVRTYSRSRTSTYFYSQGEMLSDDGLYYVCENQAVNPVIAVSIDRMANTNVMKPNDRGEIIDSHRKPVLCGKPALFD